MSLKMSSRMVVVNTAGTGTDKIAIIPVACDFEQTR